MHGRQSVLFLVVGPSGVGKDSLIAGARRKLADEAAFHFPKRLITRPKQAGGENHRAVTEAEFDRIGAAGGFMLSWTAHGDHYGIPKSAEQALEDGRSVIVNVSRKVIDRARRRWPSLRILSITAPDDVLRTRIDARGRETGADIDRRLERAHAFQVTGDDVHEVVNATDLEQAIERFVALIEQEAAR